MIQRPILFLGQILFQSTLKYQLLASQTPSCWNIETQKAKKKVGLKGNHNLSPHIYRTSVNDNYMFRPITSSLRTTLASYPPTSNGFAPKSFNSFLIMRQLTRLGICMLIELCSGFAVKWNVGQNMSCHVMLVETCHDFNRKWIRSLIRKRVERFGGQLFKRGRTCFTLGGNLPKMVKDNLQWGETTVNRINLYIGESTRHRPPFF